MLPSGLGGFDAAPHPHPEAPTSWLLPRPPIRVLHDVSFPGAIPPGRAQAHPAVSPSCGDSDPSVLMQVERHVDHWPPGPGAHMLGGGESFGGPGWGRGVREVRGLGGWGGAGEAGR